MLSFLTSLIYMVDSTAEPSSSARPRRRQTKYSPRPIWNRRHMCSMETYHRNNVRSHSRASNRGNSSALSQRTWQHEVSTSPKSTWLSSLSRQKMYKPIYIGQAGQDEPAEAGFAWPSLRRLSCHSSKGLSASPKWNSRELEFLSQSTSSRQVQETSLSV